MGDPQGAFFVLASWARLDSPLPFLSKSLDNAFFFRNPEFRIFRFWSFLDACCQYSGFKRNNSFFLLFKMLWRCMNHAKFRAYLQLKWNGSSGLMSHCFATKHGKKIIRFLRWILVAMANQQKLLSDAGRPSIKSNAPTKAPRKRGPYINCLFFLFQGVSGSYVLCANCVRFVLVCISSCSSEFRAVLPSFPLLVERKLVFYISWAFEQPPLGLSIHFDPWVCDFKGLSFRCKINPTSEYNNSRFCWMSTDCQLRCVVAQIKVIGVV